MQLKIVNYSIFSTIYINFVFFCTSAHLGECVMFLRALAPHVRCRRHAKRRTGHAQTTIRVSPIARPPLHLVTPRIHATRPANLRQHLHARHRGLITIPNASSQPRHTKSHTVMRHSPIFFVIVCINQNARVVHSRSR